MTARKRAGRDDYLAELDREPSAPPARREGKVTKGKGPRSKMTVDLPPELLGELRVGARVAGETLAAVAERALARELERLRQEHAGGRPFPAPKRRG